LQIPAFLCDFCAQSLSRFKGLQANSLRNRTGNFLNSSRELNRGIREFSADFGAADGYIGGKKVRLWLQTEGHFPAAITG
jgi:hypothetical protein